MADPFFKSKTYKGQGVHLLDKDTGQPYNAGQFPTQEFLGATREAQDALAQRIGEELPEDNTELLKFILIELRAHSLLLQQAFGINDDMNGIRSELAHGVQ